MKAPFDQAQDRSRRSRLRRGYGVPGGQHRKNSITKARKDESTKKEIEVLPAFMTLTLSTLLTI
jgi:hypothetical protein